MRPGVAFPHSHPHELAHLRPLIVRLQDVLVAPPAQASVVVHAASVAPRRGAWNVQVFHGLGDKGYSLNPLFLQRGRWPRLRTAFNAPLARLRLPAPFLRPPAKPGRRKSRYQQLNAYGPRWADLLDELVRDAEVSHFGHVALNDLGAVASDDAGPIVWLPTWDNRAYLGGANQSSLETMADEVMAAASPERPFLVKFHPLTLRHGHAKAARRRLAVTPGVTLAAPGTTAYQLLEGARAVLTDTSSIGFEAYCSGLPVAIVANPGVRHAGLHEELAERTPVLEPRRGALAPWADQPEPPRDDAWARDLLYAPDPRRNDAFAAQLRERARSGPR